ncbi:MAG: protein kinase [Gemmatimonadota bacterium]|nr:protein kinase [Gemmatimonadota bacterium]MDH3369338.1 protein kinase [Gemmatimonadota bacterium]MDH3477284.1 protein kinase [Gemmatimonadota bacterium]MDH5548658.1 protein kinase [Gemmatimonadota bacterium]
MFCSRCGTGVDDQAKFCASCGFDFSQVTPVGSVDEPEHGEITAVREALQAEWDIQEELGRGGMAIVFRARDRHLERDVAIKVLPFSLTFDRQFVERFEREARTAARLEHPHIIPIYRVGKTANVTYFVMKYLRGGSLSDLLERRGRLRVDEIRRLLIETAGALAYAHRSEIVHRDMKPDNIMFDELGHSLLMDFGIAKAATRTRITGTGMSIGTPHYMSPEQARAQGLDGRSDIYSLGVVAYQCLTGQVPFDGEDAFSIGYKHIMEPIPEPPLQTPEERELFAVIRRMMAKSREDRFQSADELEAFLQGEGAAGDRVLRTSISEATGATPDSLGAASGARRALEATPTTPIPQVEAADGAPRKKRGGALVAFFLFMFLGAGGAGGYWYFMLDGVWPPPFVHSLLAPMATPPPTPIDTAALDSLQALFATLDTPSPDSAVAGSGAVPSPSGDVPPTGTLIVSGLPAGTRWLLNGEAQSDTVVDVEPKTYHLRVTRTGYVDYETSESVGRGMRVRVVVPQLERVPLPVDQPVVRPKPVDDCAEPGPEYNKNGSCFDAAPAPSRAPILPLPDGVQGTPRTILWVLVGSDGQVKKVNWQRRSGSPRFDVAAQAFARQGLSYTPATRNGRSVDAWLLLPVTGR